jgi:hypothetical protein
MKPFRARPDPVYLCPGIVTTVTKNYTGYNLSLAHQKNPAIELHQSGIRSNQFIK